VQSNRPADADNPRWVVGWVVDVTRQPRLGCFPGCRGAANNPARVAVWVVGFREQPGLGCFAGCFRAERVKRRERVLCHASEVRHASASGCQLIRVPEGPATRRGLSNNPDEKGALCVEPCAHSNRNSPPCSRDREASGHSR
jgi:hypothetical protein